MNGLPGLIVEAHDERNEVKFQFAGIDKVVEEEKSKGADENVIYSDGASSKVKLSGMDGITYLGSEIKLPTDAIKTSQKEIDKLKEARDKDPIGFANAQMGGRNMGANVKTSTSFVAAPGGVKKAVFNNPIELPEKK